LRAEDGELFVLAVRTLIGRAPACTLRLNEPLASAEHASLAWTGGAWIVRDLGSRNGTYVDGKKIEAGEAKRLGLGTKLGFGSKSGWELIDVGAPGAMAVPLAGKRADHKDRAIISARDGLLALPDDREPELSIYQDHVGRWVIEDSEGEVVPAEDQGILTTAEGAYRLMLPVVLEGTPMVGPGMSLDRVGFRFAVSRNEERVELSLVYDGEELAIEPRDHHYVLLTLARLRAEEAELPASERGWTDREELLKMLGMEANAVNVAIHRARQQLLAAGVEGAAGVVEARSRSRRFGSDRIEIVPL
jgi:hypothetical protein